MTSDYCRAKHSAYYSLLKNAPGNNNTRTLYTRRIRKLIAHWKFSHDDSSQDHSSLDDSSRADS